MEWYTTEELENLIDDPEAKSLIHKEENRDSAECCQHKSGKTGVLRLRDPKPGIHNHGNEADNQRSNFNTAKRLQQRLPATSGQPPTKRGIRSGVSHPRS